jgi:hypothetical protein
MFLVKEVVSQQMHESAALIFLEVDRLYIDRVVCQTSLVCTGSLLEGVASPYSLQQCVPFILRYTSNKT